jgi:hypothetical protein
MMCVVEDRGFAGELSLLQEDPLLTIPVALTPHRILADMKLRRGEILVVEGGLAAAGQANE